MRRTLVRRIKKVDRMKKIATQIMIVLLVMMTSSSVSMAAAPVAPGKHIVIVDPGHGGSDAGGAPTNKLHEKDVTLMIATMLKKELDKSGNIAVMLTRSSDVELPTAERRKAISASRADIYVGIHLNAGFGKEASGYEIYFPQVTSEAAGHVDSQEIIKDMTDNRYMNDSVKLAQSIQRNIETVFPRKSRGLRSAPLVAFENLTSPAVVVEIGFSTNPEDRKKLLDENVRASIARALSKSIIEYF
jgi:N-acetylmuramoyl-L-alanine amidase